MIVNKPIATVEETWRDKRPTVARSEWSGSKMVHALSGARLVT